MWRLALRTLRFRKAGFVATSVALLFGTAIVMACGGLMETGIRNNVPPQRLAEAAVVITGDRTYELPKADPGDPEEDAATVVLPERVPVDASLVDKVDNIPGVSRAVGDVSFAVALVRAGGTVGGDVLGHSWESAPLTPYQLTRGRRRTGLGRSCSMRPWHVSGTPWSGTGSGSPATAAMPATRCPVSRVPRWRMPPCSSLRPMPNGLPVVGRRSTP
jgi:putative ABC transport system permease protein